MLLLHRLKLQICNWILCIYLTASCAGRRRKNLNFRPSFWKLHSIFSFNGLSGGGRYWFILYSLLHNTFNARRNIQIDVRSRWNYVLQIQFSSIFTTNSLSSFCKLQIWYHPIPEWLILSSMFVALVFKSSKR